MTKGAIYQRKLAAQRKEASALSPTEAAKPRMISDEDFLQLNAINEEIGEVFRVLKAVQVLTDEDPMLKLGMDRALLHMYEAASNLDEFLNGGTKTKTGKG